MKKILSSVAQKNNSLGFTIIELLIVFSILAILSTVGIASFVSYTNSQKLRNAILELKTMLQEGRSNALSQVKPASCGVLQGYEVRFCCTGGGTNCPTCLSPDDYELDAMCSSIASGILIKSSNFPDGVTVNNAQTTWRTYHFIPITGGVSKNGKITLSGSNGQQQIATVSATGVIQ